MTEYNASLELENIALQRGDRLLVRNLSFVVNSGEAIELRGANGTGKTTLLRAIAGFHRPLLGAIKFTGNKDWANCDYLMYLGHNDAIKANESVAQQLNFWADFFGAPREKIADISARLNINRILPIQGGGLSAGQRRRVAIARIMLANRPLWLLDEPFAPLDKSGREVLGQILDEHRKKGGMIIAAVHDTPFGNKMRPLDLGQFSPEMVK